MTSRTETQGAPRRRRPLGTHQGRTALAFLAPFIVIFTLYTGIPILMALGLSFTDISQGDLRTPFAVNFIGVQNFIELFQNPRFLQSSLNTIGYVVLGVSVVIVLGMLLALALDRVVIYLKSWLRAAYYIPVITNVVAAAVIWQYAFGESGNVDRTLEAFGIDAPSFLGSSPSAFLLVTGMAVWRNLGTVMVLFLAGLQSVPEEVREAAEMDGAGRLRSFWHITLPLLAPTMLLATVLMTTFFMQLFEESFLLTGGGPLGTSESVATWIYDQFGYGNIGMSFAGSFVLLAFIGLVSAAQFRLLRNRT